MGDVAVLLPTFKNRRSWLIAFGIMEILIGCLVLMAIALTAYGIRNIPAGTPNRPADMGALLMGAVFYTVVAFTFIVLGIGSVQAKRWARIAMLIVSWAWLVIGVIGAIMFAVIGPVIFAQQPNAPSLPGSAKLIIGGVLAFLFVVVPLIFISFYNSKNVKATCEHSAGIPRAMKPIPVWIATAWFAFGALGPLAIFAHPAVPMFGMVLEGWKAMLLAAALAFLNAWIAWNLYRQRHVAWKAAIGWLVLSWVSLGVTLARFGWRGMYTASGYSEAQWALSAAMLKFCLSFGAVAAVAFVVFLIATRKHYTDAEQTPALP